MNRELPVAGPLVRHLMKKILHCLGENGIMETCRMPIPTLNRGGFCFDKENNFSGVCTHAP